MYFCQPIRVEEEKLHPEQKDEPSLTPREITSSAPRSLASANGAVPPNGHESTLDNEVVINEPENAKVYNSWISPTTLGRRPAARYQVSLFLVMSLCFILS